MAIRTDTRLPLSRERILRKALELVDQGGVDALTMRKLGQALGFEAMSLYNHVASKADLLDGLLDLVIDEIELPDDRSWEAAVRRCAISAHDVLLRHPWACNLVMSGTGTGVVSKSRLRYMEWLLGTLREAGFSADLTYHAYHAIDSHVLGFTLWQLGHAAGAKALAREENFPGGSAAAFLEQLRGQGYTYLAEHGEQHIAAPEGDGQREFEFSLDLILGGHKRVKRQRR
jgi:AcrR family transcriptional regulator